MTFETVYRLGSNKPFLDVDDALYIEPYVRKALAYFAEYGTEKSPTAVLAGLHEFYEIDGVPYTLDQLREAVRPDEDVAEDTCCDCDTGPVYQDQLAFNGSVNRRIDKLWGSNVSFDERLNKLEQDVSTLQNGQATLAERSEEAVKQNELRMKDNDSFWEELLRVRYALRYGKS